MNTRFELSFISEKPAGKSSELDNYSAPSIESVISLEELEREVHYAGVQVTVVVA